MKSLMTILLMGLFLSVQYARQLNYLECKLSNNFRPVTEQCDCEQLPSTEKSGEELPFHANHFHINIDEFFVAEKHICSGPKNVNLQIAYCYFSSITEGFKGLHYTPPEA